MLWHAHNLFVGQILQTGTIGLALFLALLVALCARFIRYLRHNDDALAVVGVVGLALIAGFVAKNMTDDFLFRSNAKEFWGLLALLIGIGTRLEQAPPGSLSANGNGGGLRLALNGRYLRRCANTVTEPCRVVIGARGAYSGINDFSHARTSASGTSRSR